jgi:uncharacterized protein (DUF3820 family)
VKLTFGKHEGEDVENVPMSYLWWLWEHEIPTGELKEAIRQRIEPERYDTRLESERTPSLAELAAKVREYLVRQRDAP